MFTDRASCNDTDANRMSRSAKRHQQKPALSISPIVNRKLRPAGRNACTPHAGLQSTRRPRRTALPIEEGESFEDYITTRPSRDEAIAPVWPGMVREKRWRSRAVVRL